ncbi:MAG TPA: multiheme c-type cytochrome [Kofleriaceae bacterium]|nr:multiheme c-type cytochrome [Kofleriaceae bacterium]
MKNGGSGSAAVDPPGKPTLTVFALAEVRGQIGPCGCTSDPLGDIARTAKLVQDARAAGPTLFVDAGSLLYSKNPVPPHLDAQEELKADLLVQTYKEELAVGALGLGPADLVKGPAKIRVPRQAANVAKGAGIETAPPAIVEVGGAKVGMFGLVADGAVPTLAVTDPVTAGKTAVGELRGKGARVVIAMIQAPTKKDAAKLVRDIGNIDIAVAGLGINQPEPERVDIEAQKVNGAWLVVPANRGQIVSRIDITLRDGTGLVDAIGPAVANAKIAGYDRQIAELDADLARFKDDASADPAFVKQKQAERAQLVADRDQLKAKPLAIPAAGSYFTLQQVRINKQLACSPSVDDRVTVFYRQAGEANVKAAAGKKPPPPPKGQAGYVGAATCDDCHSDAVEFWKTTRHAHAWETLVKRGQQFDFDCINCHVTGWDKPGGSNLAFNEPLRDVQCETCHGPSSIHVAKGGEEKPPAVIRNPPLDLCATQCHTKEHSDTFQYEAYLRDVLGPGHGEALRKKLGDGPTGHELRKAALDKAGRALGAGCSR